MRFSYDIAIALAAEKNKIPTVALDTDTTEFHANCREIYQQIFRFGADQMELRYMEHVANKEHELLPFMMFWKEGNKSAIKKVRQAIYPALLDREDRWTKKLLPHLENTREPIAIAVGFLHVTGFMSLSKRFKKAGLSVKRLTSFVKE